MKEEGKRGDKEPAYLDCQSTPPCGKWVKHTYKENRRAVSKVDGKEVPFQEVIYVCAKCGAERRWGTEC